MISKGILRLKSGTNISKKASSIAKEMVTSQKNISQELKYIGTDYVVQVANECNLSEKNHGDIDHLASATSCTVHGDLHEGFCTPYRLSNKSSHRTLLPLPQEIWKGTCVQFTQMEDE